MTTLQYVETEPLPIGAYPAKIVNTEMVTGQFGEQVSFSIEVAAPDGKPRNLRAWASASLGPKSKLFRWASALLGAEAIKARGFDPASIVGRECIVELVVETRDDGSAFNKVVNLKSKDAPKAARLFGMK